MYMSDKIIGHEFKHDMDPNAQFICIGYSQSPGQPHLIIGSTWDQASNRTRINTFKFGEIKFVGQFPIP